MEPPNPNPAAPTPTPPPRPDWTGRQSRTDPWIGRRIGDFLVRGVLGAGPVGLVYAARDERLGRDVALKAVTVDDAGSRAALIAESRMLAALAHPSLLTVFAVGEADGRMWVASELADGGSLAALVARNGPAPAPEAAMMIAAAARGLHHAHRAGVVHRAVRPGNLFLVRNGALTLVKVGDFSLARSLAETRRLTRGGLTAEQVRHVAPEVCAGQPAAPAGDVFSLGSVLYFLLAGRPAVAGTSVTEVMSARMRAGPCDLASVRPDAGTELAELCAWATDPDPSRRPADADAFADRLKAAAARLRSGTSVRGLAPVSAQSSPPPASASAASSAGAGSSSARSLPAAAPPGTGSSAAALASPSVLAAAAAAVPATPEPPSSGAEPSDVRAPPGYRILAELGRGGMGVVYKARDNRLNRPVALKMILAGAHAGEADRVRLLKEAEAAARLTHPGIVQVYEVGEHGGLPYLALEYCEGGSLADRLRGHPQPARQSAEWLEQVARAMDVAHRSGVVHRDLKPANILLDAAGRPKVADFGLARRADSAVAAATRTGAMQGTPSYMAPEQAEGLRNAGAPADVYSLGVILYECLTGRPPFLGESDVHILWQLLNNDPVPVRRLSPRAPADLETICHRCLRKDPRRRYRTAGDLADDLRAFLEGRPIRARPVGAVERTAKWVRRNPAAAALIAVSALAAAGLAGGGAWYGARLSAALAEATRERDAKEAERADAQRARDDAERSRSEALAVRDDAERSRAEALAAARKAEENLAFAREAVDKCFTLASEDPRFKAAGMQEARDALLSAAREFYGRIGSRRADDPLALREKGLAHLRAADSAADLGETARAKADYRAALEAFARLTELQPGEVGHWAALGAAHVNFGRYLKEIGESAAAAARHAEAVKVWERVVGRAPGVDEYRHNLALALGNRAVARRDAGDAAGARPDFRRALELHEALAAAHPEEDRYLAERGNTLLNFGNLATSEGRPDEARDAYRRALGIFEAVAARKPRDGQYLALQAMTLSNLGLNDRDAGRFRESAESLRRAADLYARLVEANPAVPDMRAKRAGCLYNLGLTLEDAGDAAAARRTMEAALAAAGKLAAEFPRNAAFAEREAEIRKGLGGLLRDAEPAAARDHLRAAADILERLVRETPPAPRADAEAAARLFSLAAARNDLGSALKDLGDREGSRAAYASARSILERLARERPGNALYKAQLAACDFNFGRLLRMTGELPAAMESLVRARDVSEALLAQAPGTQVPRLVLAKSLFDIACVQARLSAGPGADKAAAERLAAESVASLDRAMRIGLVLSGVREEPDLAPVRARDDYKRLIAEWETRERK